MANYSSCAVVVLFKLCCCISGRDTNKYWELSLLLLPFSVNRIINNFNYNMDRVGKSKLVLIVVTIDNLVCFSSVSISFLLFI